jgi:hypothetical protein
MNHFKISGLSKFLAGLIAGAVIFSGSAVAVNRYISDNTPEGGYLLCANNKTKAVTFPNKMSCPSGTTALDMGAINLVEGPEGPEGPQGPAGISSGGKVYWTSNSNAIDIVADGTINSTTSMVRKIMLTLKSSDLPSGYYRLEGHITGLWADSAGVGSLVQCYFQSSTDYDANGGRKWGTAATERKSWNNVNMNVLGDWSTSLENTIYLVCRTSGTLKGLQVQVDLVTSTMAGKLTSTSGT